MNTNILFHLKAYIPGFNEYPLEKAKDWADSYYQSALKTRDALLKSVPDKKAFRQKLAKPLMDVTREMLNPDFISKSGLNRDAILGKMQEKLRDKSSAEKFQRKIEKAYRTVDGVPAKKIKDKLDITAVNYALKMTFGAWRFAGPVQGEGKGALKLIESWLTGNPASQSLLRKQDQVITGQPALITPPDKAGQFRKKLHNQLLRSGNLISDLRYQPDVIKGENDIINQLVNQYIREGIIPFEPGGLRSHLDFAIIPASIEPDDSPLIKDIHYRAYAYFIGKEKADYLKARWTITPRAVKPNPAEYLCTHGKKAHFDMFLDIQVSQTTD